jgi:YHS domain-containing protein
MKASIDPGVRCLIIALILSMSVSVIAGSRSPINSNWRGIAIHGYDPVAYFADGQPVEGKSEFQIEWKGATWRFASAEHREMFKADPEKYAPKYGGYCAWAVAHGSTADVDPKNAWKIAEGKLYLNYSSKIQSEWNQDIPGYIQKADANWPGVLNK